MSRVAVIGARRRRQGLGEFVAAAFARLGAEVVAVVGTTLSTAREAASALAERHGLRPRAYDSVEALLDREALDIVAVCSPYEAHAAQVEAVGEAGLHCLAEKPFWWGPGPQRTVTTRRLIEPFLRSGRLLGLITQWPCTLPAFEALHPGALGGGPEGVETFEMRLSPISRGPDRVLDSAPHPLSILEALVGGGVVQAATARFEGEDDERLTLEFQYVHAHGRVACRLHLVQSEDVPRTAWYAVNGRAAHRRIVQPGYRTVFDARPLVGRGEARAWATESAAVGASPGGAGGPGLLPSSPEVSASVEVADPLEVLLEGFLRGVRNGEHTDAGAIERGMVALEELFVAATKAAEGREASVGPQRS